MQAGRPAAVYCAVDAVNHPAVMLSPMMRTAPGLARLNRHVVGSVWEMVGVAACAGTGVKATKASAAMLPPMRRLIFNCAPKVSRQYRPNRCRTARVGGIGQPFGGTVYGCVMAEVIISGWR